MKRIFILLSAILCANTLLAQIPNSSFEDWSTAGGYDTPTGWDNLNAMTSSMSVFTCMKGSPGYSGASYLKLISKTVSGMGVMPGIAVSGVLDMSSFNAVSGFPYTARPTALAGMWQYMASGSDQGYVTILLSKWDTAMNMRDTVAYTRKSLTDMEMSWASFSIPLTYLSSANPDSAIIVLSASGSLPVSGSYLFVDSLQFIPATTGVSAIHPAQSEFVVFPNPAASVLTISYTATTVQPVQLELDDINGKAVQKATVRPVLGLNDFTLDVSKIARGTYIIRMSGENNSESHKVSIN